MNSRSHTNPGIVAKIARLQALRKALGWSEEWCAHELGVTYSTLNRWERGESLPRSQVVLKAIDALIAQHERRAETDLSLGGVA